MKSASETDDELAPQNGDEDLALQPVAPAAESAAPQQHHRPRPVEFSGQGSSRSGLLVPVAGLAAVALAAVLCIHFGVFSSSAPENVPEQASAGKATPASPAKTPVQPAPAKTPATPPKTAASAAAPGTAAAKPEAAPASSINPANAESFHAFLRFMNWARGNASWLDNEQLAVKFDLDVDLAKVDDAELRRLCELIRNCFMNVPGHPLRTPGSGPLPPLPGLTPDDDSTPRAQQAWKTIEPTVTELTQSALKRYGPLPPNK